MYRTLVADDDFLVRSYLKTLDSWEKAGYEIVDDAEDGEEAYGFLQKEKIDVLVTDLTMPVMDGIELIRKIREENRDIYIIVLSCHDDFEYVKEAMRLGADEYVLKNSLDEDSLYDTLEKSARLIENRRKKSQEQAQARKLIHLGSHALKYYFFNGLISGMLKNQAREEKRVEAGIAGKYFNSAVICMFMERWAERERQWTPLEVEQYSHHFRHRLLERTEELLGTESEFTEVIYLGAGIFCCFLDLSRDCRTSAMQQRLTEVAAICYRHCQEDFCDFGISVSSVCMGEEGIRQAYQQAREMMKLHFYEKKEILYFEGRKKADSVLPESADRLETQISALKAGKDRKKAEELWEQVLTECQNRYTDGRLLVQWLKKLNQTAGLEKDSTWYEEIEDFEEFREKGNSCISELFAGGEDAVPEGISAAVKKALEFIREHYEEQISLQDAADAAEVNPAYLSYLFKQEMKIGFSNYVQELRIDCAKKLLSGTNCRVKDVALRSGFGDYHYFSKTFKKITGMSPAEYRKGSGIS